MARTPTDEEARVEKELRKRLEDFPLYEPWHWMHVTVKDNKVIINYAPKPFRWDNTEQTYFHIEIHGETFFLQHLYINREQRRKGNGSKLYQILEQFCEEEFNCLEYRTTAATEMTQGFVRKQGFKQQEEEAFFVKEA